MVLFIQKQFQDNGTTQTNYVQFTNNIYVEINKYMNNAKTFHRFQQKILMCMLTLIQMISGKKKLFTLYFSKIIQSSN